MKSVFFAALLFAASFAQAEQYIVKYKTQRALQQLEMVTIMSSSVSGMSVVDEHQPGSYVVVDVAPSVEAQQIGELMNNPEIEWVTPNVKVQAYSTPEVGTTMLKDQWAIAKVQAEKAWTRAGNRGSRKVIVAVVDTGTDYRHQSLAPNIVPGYDFLGNDADPMDEIGRNPGHGTHCAGIIGATGLIEGGTVGISPEVSIMPVRFLDKNGSGDLNNGIKAIDYAVAHGAQVISASWGASVPRAQATALIEAVKRASDAGVIFVVAAANNADNNDSVDVFPANARFENTIAVAASGSQDTKPSWSNYGREKVDLASPGEAIMSTLPNDKYGNLSGTSMATPLVAGMVALLKAQDPSLTGAQVKALLQTTAAKVNIETACNCRVDAFAAMDYLLSKKPWIVPAATSLDVNENVNLSVVNGQAPFHFTTSNPLVATVDDTGVLHGVVGGVVTVTMTDANGQTVTSSDFNVRLPKPAKPPVQQCSVDSKVCRAICWLFPRMKMCPSKP